MVKIDIISQGPGNGGAEGGSCHSSFGKLIISPMVLHGKKWAENISCPSNFFRCSRVHEAEIKALSYMRYVVWDCYEFMTSYRKTSLTGGGTGVHQGTVPPLECEIWILILRVLHGKNEFKSRWCPSLRSAVPPLVASLLSSLVFPILPCCSVSVTTLTFMVVWTGGVWECGGRSGTVSVNWWPAGQSGPLLYDGLAPASQPRSEGRHSQNKPWCGQSPHWWIRGAFRAPPKTQSGLFAPKTVDRYDF